MWLVLALAPCAVLLAYYLWQMRTAPEPWQRVAGCVMAGMVACGIALVALPRIAALGLEGPALALLAVGPIEEALKLAAVLLAVGNPARYTRLSSGLIYIVAAAMGFSAVENIAYVSRYGAEVGLLRMVSAVPAHALHAAFMGLQLGRVRRSASRRSAWLYVLLSWLVAALVHGLYDAGLEAPPALRGLVALLLLAEAAVIAALLRQAWREDLQRDIDLLSRLPLLSKTPVAAIRRLAESGVKLAIGKGQIVVHEGRSGDALYIIIQGALQARWRNDDREAAHEMVAGDVFGELALLTKARRSADVEATADSLLLRVSRHGLHDAVLQVDGFAETLVAVARERAGDIVLPTADQLRDEARATRAAITANGVSPALFRHFEAVDILTSLSASERAELAAACTTKKRGMGMTIIRQGRAGRALHLILVGQVEILADNAVVTTLGEGDFFGEISLLTGWKTTATVRCATPVELAVLDWDELEELVSRSPSIGVGILAGLASRKIAGTRGDRGRARHLSVYPQSAQNAEVTALRREIAELGDLPVGVAEALAAHIAHIDSLPDGAAPPTGIWLIPDGGIDGLREVLAGDPAPPPPRLPAWLLPGDQLDDVIARNPAVLHLLARALCSR